MRVHVINVGYGDALLFEFPGGENMLVDAGDRDHSKELTKYVRSLNIDALHAAVITHTHHNHFEGFFELLDVLAIGRVFINGDQKSEEGFTELLDKFDRTGVDVKVLARGDGINALPEGVTVDCLHPARLDRSINGNSLVLRVAFKNTSMVLFADVGEEELAEVLTEYPDISGADAILVPHHGKTIIPELAAAFTDKIFVLSTGPNKWGLPDEDKIRTLKGQVYRTDRDGTVILESDGERFHAINPRP